MLRRLTASLVVCLALLWGVEPVLACSIPPDAKDCCPDGVPSPCNPPETVKFAASFCCVAVPSQAPAASAPLRSHEAKHTDLGSPDPLILTAWVASLVTLAEPPPEISSFVPRRRPDALLTYLHTGRLRL